MTVNGVVTDASNNEELIGVTVYPIGNLSSGTATDYDGSFQLNANVGDTLIFNFLGYVETKILVATESVINVAMEPETMELDEVVITALGMKREKKSLGYATQEVDGESISETRELNMVNSLSGKVAGVNITQGGGGLGGGGARIVIRGETSLSGGNGPLFVIDGVPGGSNDVASDDIASISVLKGPAAAALYGSRAAAGVILVTTKSGAGSKDRIGAEVNMSISTQNPFILPRYQNEFGQGSGGQYKYFDGNNGTWPDGSISNDDSRINWGPRFDGELRPQFNGNLPWIANPNNVRDFYETGMIFNNNAAVYGSSKAGDFRLSYTNIAQKGIIPNTGLRTDRIDFGATLNLSEKLSIRANIKYIESSSDNNQGSDPRLTPRNIDLEALQNYWVPGLEGLQQLQYRASENNPYFLLYENTSNFDNLRLLGNVTANYQITEKLSLMGRVGQNRSYTERYDREAFSTVGPNNRFGSFYGEQGKGRELNADFLVRYQQDFGSSLNAIFSFGGNHLETDGSSINGNVNQLLVPDIYNLGNRRVYPTTGNGFSEKQLNSLYGFANFAYKNFLYLDVTARNDWSSSLPSDNNSYFYPSFTLSGLVHEVVKLPSAISFMKLRGGIARVGSDTGPYALQDAYRWGQGENGVASIIQSSTKANPTLKPELTSAWEVGTDLRFFNNRLQVDATYYNSVTSNQILRVEVSPATGYDFILKNAGKIRSTGVELMINGDIIQKKDFNWNATINWSRDRSIVEEYDPESPDAFLSRGVTNFLFVEDKLGERRGAMYGKSFQKAPNGKLLFTKSGDTQRGVKEFLGNYNPDWMGSLYNNFQYKNISLGFLVDVRYGGVFYSSTNYNLNIRGLSEETLLGGIGPDGNLVPRDFIVPDGMYLDDDGTYKELTADVLKSSGLSSGGLTGQQYWENIMDAEIPEAVIYDASYLKFRELNISYDLPEDWVSKMKLNNANFGIVIRNLAIFTDVPNVDAETFSRSEEAGNVPGLDRGGTPSVRNIAFNLNLKF
jgi:TonB-linked SusC/RagA family outer membrane protein